VNAWTTVSDLATGAGTLVLAVATFASVRSANRSARTAETTRKAGMRPILMNSRLQDPAQKVSFADEKWLGIPGSGAAVEVTGETVYLAVSLRNAGTGMGILHGWRICDVMERGNQRRPELSEFTAQTRDMYVPSGDVGFWQGALRDPSAEIFKHATAAIDAGTRLTLDLLYGDFEGGQRVISRFTLAYSPYGHREHGQTLDRGGQPGGQAEGAPDRPGAAHGRGDLTVGQKELLSRPASARWIASVVRHWNVDQADPRETQVLAQGG
jgi:hypothetical protein